MWKTVLALLVAAAPALADEVWETPFGRVYWETDIGDTAVLRQDLPEGGIVRLYVPGLARDVGGDRGAYFGFWTQTGPEGPCDTQMIDKMGTRTANWGTLQITFVNPRFPSDWAGLIGTCFNPADEAISGVAMVGG